VPRELRPSFVEGSFLGGLRDKPEVVAFSNGPGDTTLKNFKALIFKKLTQHSLTEIRDVLRHEAVVIDL
jgi:hypothetical protein